MRATNQPWRRTDIRQQGIQIPAHSSRRMHGIATTRRLVSFPFDGTAAVQHGSRLHDMTGASWSHTGSCLKVRRLVVAALRTVCVYLFAGWVYIALIAVIRPDSLNTPLWHQVTWLRRDTFGVIAFAVSCACYFVLQVLRIREKSEKR